MATRKKHRAERARKVTLATSLIGFVGIAGGLAFANPAMTTTVAATTRSYGTAVAAPAPTASRVVTVSNGS
jgi:hypothetical protein